MENTTYYILLGIIITLIIWSFLVILNLPIWILMILFIVVRYKDIKEFINR